MDLLNNILAVLEQIDKWTSVTYMVFVIGLAYFLGLAARTGGFSYPIHFTFVVMIVAALVGVLFYYAFGDQPAKLLNGYVWAVSLYVVILKRIFPGWRQPNNTKRK